MSDLFLSLDAGIAAILERALPVLHELDRPRMLDLGCGSGVLAIGCARAMPTLEIVAMDISQANCDATSLAIREAQLEDRIRVVCADYLRWSTEPFDLVASDGVLQLIESDNKSLARKLANDLKPDGVMLATLPSASTANNVRQFARHIWRRTPKAADGLALAVAKVVYPKIDPAVLAGRVPYMRCVPVRRYDSGFRTAFADAGLDFEFDIPVESTSIAKFDHRLIGFKKR